MHREAEYLAHFGVKGMKWGVRKKYEHYPRSRRSFRDNARVRRLQKQKDKAVRDASRPERQRVRRRNMKIAAVIAAAAGLSAGAYFASRKVGDVRRERAHNQQLFNNFMDQISNIPTMATDSQLLVTNPFPGGSVMNASARRFSDAMTSSFDQAPLDDMLNDLNADMLGNIQNMMRGV